VHRCRGDNELAAVLQWGDNQITLRLMNPEQIIAIIHQKSAAGAGEALRASKALGEGDRARANTYIYRAARLALADTSATLTAFERVLLITTIDETEPRHIGSRITSIRIHLGEDEYTTLVARAGEQGMTSSAYMRWAALYNNPYR